MASTRVGISVSLSPCHLQRHTGDVATFYFQSLHGFFPLSSRAAQLAHYKSHLLTKEMQPENRLDAPVYGCLGGRVLSPQARGRATPTRSCACSKKHTVLLPEACSKTAPSVLVVQDPVHLLASAAFPGAHPFSFSILSFSGWGYTF